MSEKDKTSETQYKSRVLPETRGNLFCAEVAGRVTLEDYKTVFHPHITEMLAQHSEGRIFLYYNGPFLGWDLDAASFDFSQILEKGSRIKKVALVNPPENVLTRWDKLKPLFGGEIRIFGKDEYDTAMDWVQQ